jgi:hypothetical protein
MHGGDWIAREALQVWQGTFKPLAQETLTKEEYESVQRLLMDPTLYIPLGTIFCAWGRKPVTGQ